MTVGELRKVLEAFDDGIPVIVYDDEGPLVASCVDLQPFALDQPDPEGDVRAHDAMTGMYCVVIV